MDYEAILERARLECAADFIGAFARGLVHEWCEVYEAMSQRTTKIVRFQYGTFEYIYDDYASLEATGRVPYDPVVSAVLSGIKMRQITADDALLKSGKVVCLRRRTEAHYRLKVGGQIQRHFETSMRVGP
jgi:hypothetical protein